MIIGDRTYIADIARAVRAGYNDAQLDPVIQQYIDDSDWSGTPPTVAQWRLTNYEALRNWKFPTLQDLSEAVIKIHIGTYLSDTNMQAAGRWNIKRYTRDYYAAINQFPDGTLSPPGDFDKVEITADGIDAATITGVPNLTKIGVDDGTPVNVSTGSWSFSTATPGTYFISIIPYDDHLYAWGFWLIDAS